MGTPLSYWDGTSWWHTSSGWTGHLHRSWLLRTKRFWCLELRPSVRQEETARLCSAGRGRWICCDRKGLDFGRRTIFLLKSSENRLLGSGCVCWAIIIHPGLLRRSTFGFGRGPSYKLNNKTYTIMSDRITSWIILLGAFLRLRSRLLSTSLLSCRILRLADAVHFYRKLKQKCHSQQLSTLAGVDSLPPESCSLIASPKTLENHHRLHWRAHCLDWSTLHYFYCHSVDDRVVTRNIPKKFTIWALPNFDIIAGGASKGIFSWVLYHSSNRFFVVCESIDASACPNVPHFNKRVVASSDHMRLALLGYYWANSMGVTN